MINFERFHKAGALSEPELGDFTTTRRLGLLSIMSLAIGIVSACVAAGLLWLINLVTNIAYHHRYSGQQTTPAHNHLGLWAVFVPVCGGLIVGFMARFGTEKIRGHGIPEAIEAILIGRSRIGPKVALLKPLSSAIVIGTGGPFGAEGPIIMTGGAFGSLFAQLFHLSPAERKTLLVAGAAAGMAAVFATPIAAVLLAVELLLFEWKPRSLVPVAVASITAAAVRVLLLGSGPIFATHTQTFPILRDYPEAVVAGIASGLVACLLTWLVYRFEDLFKKLPVHWMWWPAIGGLAVGIGGLVDPRVLGIGYNLIHSMLDGNMIEDALLMLFVMKALVWAIALGSGTSGGVLAPLLILGGAFGAFVGHIFGLPDAGLWAAIGMASVMAGTMRAPFTATVFLLELTHDIGATPLIFAASIAAVAVTVLMMKRSILTERIARRGYHITREYSIDPAERVRVGEVMDRVVQSVPATLLVSDLAQMIAHRDPSVSRHHALAISGENGELVGIVTRGDIARAMDIDSVAPPMVIDAGVAEVVTSYPDEPIRSALRRMLHHRIGRLIVVERGASTRPVGYIGRQAILDAQVVHFAEEHDVEPGLLHRLMAAKDEVS